MQFSDNEIVISFYKALMTMIKEPQEKRRINWQLRFFDKRISSPPHGNGQQIIQLMREELALCKQRRRSRRWFYNASEIDDVLSSYYISNRSETQLARAWDLFYSERYKVCM